MISNNINQTKLFGHNELFLNLKFLFDNNKLPNKILFSGQKGIGKCTLTYHFINYILSKKEDFPYDIENFQINEFNRSHKLICNNSHPNFFQIKLEKNKKNIDISQVREMISFTNKSSFDSSYKIIIIDNLECLNSSSANALLKVIEEPNDKVLFFLIHDNRKKKFNTLVSRCIKFNVHLTKNIVQNILNSLIGNTFYKELNDDFKNYYHTPGDLINLYNYISEKKTNFKNVNIEEFINKIINDGSFKNDDYIKNNLLTFIELFFFKKFNNQKNRNNIYLLYKQFLHRIKNVKKYNLDIENLLVELNFKLLNG